MNNKITDFFIWLALSLILSTAVLGGLSLATYKAYTHNSDYMYIIGDCSIFIEYIMLFIFPIFIGYNIKFRLFSLLAEKIYIIGKIKNIKLFSIALDIFSVILNSLIPFIIVTFVWVCTCFNVAMQIVD